MTSLDASVCVHCLHALACLSALIAYPWARSLARSLAGRLNPLHFALACRSNLAFETETELKLVSNLKAPTQADAAACSQVASITSTLLPLRAQIAKLSAHPAFSNHLRGLLQHQREATMLAAQQALKRLGESPLVLMHLDEEALYAGKAGPVEQPEMRREASLTTGQGVATTRGRRPDTQKGGGTSTLPVKGGEAPHPSGTQQPAAAVGKRRQAAVTKASNKPLEQPPSTTASDDLEDDFTLPMPPQSQLGTPQSSSPSSSAGFAPSWRSEADPAHAANKVRYPETLAAAVSRYAEASAAAAEVVGEPGAAGMRHHDGEESSEAAKEQSEVEADGPDGPASAAAAAAEPHDPVHHLNHAMSALSQLMQQAPQQQQWQDSSGSPTAAVAGSLPPVTNAAGIVDAPGAPPPAPAAGPSSGTILPPPLPPVAPSARPRAAKARPQKVAASRAATKQQLPTNGSIAESATISAANTSRRMDAPGSSAAAPATLSGSASSGGVANLSAGSSSSSGSSGIADTLMSHPVLVASSRVRREERMAAEIKQHEEALAIASGKLAAPGEGRRARGRPRKARASSKAAK